MDTRAITLDRSSRVPLYFQVAQQVEAAITAGTLGPGDRLTDEVTWAQELGLSRPTVRQAIALLVDKGLLVRRRGVGTQVVHGQVRRSLELTSLHDDLRSAGQDPRTEVLRLERGPADEETAAELQVAVGEDVWWLDRLRLIGTEPLALMSNRLPVTVLDLAQVDLTDEGLYAALRRTGVLLSVARQRVGARRASGSEARRLGERSGAPLLTMDRTAYDNSGRPVEVGRHLYRPDLYSFELTLVER